jgi:ketosteroid isomerase-like protein
MIKTRHDGLLLMLVGLLVAACASAPQGNDTAQQKAQVMATERAFAKTMADRDLAAFASFVSNEAVFYSGPEPRRGKAAVVDFWKRFYDKPDPPFSWEPESVEVLDSGTLALSTGPVRDRNGKQIATFSSIWRLEAPGTWRIIFDKGEAACDCATK